MASVVHSGKPLTVNPLKVSQPMGAALAFLGFDRAMPLEHGAQGCTAFSKVFFTRHFREPIPLQTTAMNHAVTVMGADEHIVEALATIARNERPALIGLASTGLSETQGADLAAALREFRRRHEECERVKVVAVHTPDTQGCLESGYAAAVEALIEALVPRSTSAGRQPWQVNVLASSMLTPADIDAIKLWIEAWGLHPVVLPDISGSLDGHLAAEGYANLSQGGCSLQALGSVGESVGTLVIGASLNKAADLLKARTGVPDYRFDGLMGLKASDAFSATLAELCGRPMPGRIARQRSQLEDALVDCHFSLGGARLALAADPDLLASLTRFVASLGAEPTVLVAAARAPVLETLEVPTVLVGDLEDLERLARAARAELLLTNSHGVAAARRLGLPILRAGFPIHDHAGAQARQWVGYGGSRQTLYELANLLGEQRARIAPYTSRYRQPDPRAAAAPVTC